MYGSLAAAVVVAGSFATGAFPAGVGESSARSKVVLDAFKSLGAPRWRGCCLPPHEPEARAEEEQHTAGDRDQEQRVEPELCLARLLEPRVHERRELRFLPVLGLGLALRVQLTGDDDRSVDTGVRTFVPGRLVRVGRRVHGEDQTLSNHQWRSMFMVGTAFGLPPVAHMDMCGWPLTTSSDAQCATESIIEPEHTSERYVVALFGSVHCVIVQLVSVLLSCALRYSSVETAMCAMDTPPTVYILIRFCCGSIAYPESQITARCSSGGSVANESS
uniref:Uncharacterized protein n=1 Tax=Globisporangium ultimum (strain ATCC 200006 / CBS 805.95 / DAOM BR144) TaxID=431595 RepID=K3WNA7_GLOUD